MSAVNRVFVAEMETATGHGWTSVHTHRADAEAILDEKAEAWGIGNVENSRTYGISRLPIEGTADEVANLGGALLMASMTRSREVIAYAQARSITPAEAIVGLVNRALSDGALHE